MQSSPYAHFSINKGNQSNQLRSFKVTRSYQASPITTRYSQASASPGSTLERNPRGSQHVSQQAKMNLILNPADSSESLPCTFNGEVGGHNPSLMTTSTHSHQLPLSYATASQSSSHHHHHQQQFASLTRKLKNLSNSAAASASSLNQSPNGLPGMGTAPGQMGGNPHHPHHLASAYSSKSQNHLATSILQAASNQFHD